MEPNDLASRRNDMTIVDVREDSEWDAGHVPWAIHIPLDRIEAEKGRFDPSRPIVTICKTGPRSERAAQALRAAGFSAEHLNGGIVAWHHWGGAVVQDDGREGYIEGHDHSDQGQGPDEGVDPELENFQDDFLAISMALHERFGDREPTDAEAKDFMREWLQAKGTPEAEIEKILSD